MSKPEVRPATAADIEAFYGRPLAHTARAVVAIVDGRPAGVAGVMFTPTGAMAFSDMKPPMRPLRRAIARTIHAFERLIREIGLPTAAVANPAEPTSPALLLKLGFSHIGTVKSGDAALGVYRWAPK